MKYTMYKQVEVSEEEYLQRQKGRLLMYEEDSKKEKARHEKKMKSINDEIEKIKKAISEIEKQIK